MSMPHVTKWLWMMDYCKKSHISPASPENWHQAEKAYEKFILEDKQ